MTVISFLAYMGLEPEVACRARQSKSRLAMLKISLTFPVSDIFIRYFICSKPPSSD